ncbi:TRAP transporter small permease [Lachnospiraceae bacterium 62-35]
MQVFNRIIDACLNILAMVAGIALGFLLIAICYSTFSRVVFHDPMSNLIEYSAYSLIYITFLGAPWILKQRGHITVDIILEAMSKKKKLFMNMLTDIAGGIICIVIFWQGCIVTLSNIQDKIKVMDSMGTPQFLLIIVIPIGSFFMAIQFLRNSAEDFKLWKAGET